MKDAIIYASIESLRQEGLKFSVDTLASKLKISKKTIYKFFPDKETLALSLYEKYYDDAKVKAELLTKIKTPFSNLDLLRLYFDSKVMTRKEIFNKYKLNASINSYAAEQNDCLWKIISESFKDGMPGQDTETIRIVVDGSFEKLCENRMSPDAVIERLAKLL